MAKTLDFKDFMVVDYAPGMDPIIKRAAKKRKLDAGAGSNAEYSSTYAPDEQIDTIDEAEKQLFMDPADKMWKVSYDHGPHQSNTIKVKAKSQSHAWEVAKQVAKKKYGHNRITSGSVESMKEEVELDEALNAQQRRLRALQMKRMKSKIELGKERAARRFADKDRLMTRARRQARSQLFKRITKGQSKDELTYQRRQEIEKRLDSPAMKKIIDRIAIKMLPKERQAEIQRHKSGGQQ
jgi:hypothetical protein